MNTKIESIPPKPNPPPDISLPKPSEAIPPKPNPLPNISLSKPSNKYQSPSPHTSKNIIKISPVSKKIKKSKNRYITWKQPLLAKKIIKNMSPKSLSINEKTKESSKNSFLTNKNTKRKNTDDILNLDAKKGKYDSPRKRSIDEDDFDVLNLDAKKGKYDSSRKRPSDEDVFDNVNPKRGKYVTLTSEHNPRKRKRADDIFNNNAKKRKYNAWTVE